MPHVTFTDKELVRQVVGGQTDAYGQLVQRHIHGAYAIAYAQVGNASDAEDAVQEAFLRALEKLHNLRDPAKFGSWLLTIARNEAVRVATKRVRAETNPSVVPDVVVPDVSSKELNALVREQVMRLPELHREVLLLHYFTGRDTKEIADLLSIRRGAVLKRLQRAREQLAETLLRDLEGERPTESSFANQVARITALAGALGVATGPATAGVTAAAGAQAVALKWAIGATILLVAGLAAIRMNESTAPASTELGELPVVRIALEDVAAAANEATQNVPVVAAPPVVNAVVSNTDQVIATNTSFGVNGAAESNLAGTWYVNTFRSKNSVTQEPVEIINGQFKIIDQNGVLKFADLKHDWPHEGSGRVIGDRITLDLIEIWPHGRRLHLHAEGPFTPGATQLELTGWTVTSMPPSTDFPDGITGEKEIVDSVWTRVPADHAAEDAFVVDRAEELTALYGAIVAYYAEHQRVPMRVEELVPRFLSNLNAFSPQLGVTDFSYFPPKHFVPVDELRHMLYQDLGPENYPPDNREERRQLTVELEHALRRTSDPDGSGWPLIIARATYGEYPITITLDAHGQWNRGEDFPCGTRPYPDGPGMEPSVEVCASQLRIAAHGVVNFMRRSGLSPAGWFTMLFERTVSKPCFLTCPVATSEDLSYELLFPSVSFKELEATYVDLFAPDDSIPQSRTCVGCPANAARIPIVIETAECGTSGGRHVGFLDGHVEFRDGRLEDYPDLAPFLNLR